MKALNARECESVSGGGVLAKYYYAAAINSKTAASYNRNYAKYTYFSKLGL